MIKAVLVDDELNALIVLKNLLKTYCSHINVIATASNIYEADQLIKVSRPDVVFLDIAMPGGSGFDLLDKIENITFEVVIVTAYEDFAVKAFNYAVLHYLMKPLKHTALMEVEQRLIRKLNMSDEDGAGKKKSEKSLILSTSNGVEIVNPDEIIYLESEGNYTFLFFKGRDSVLMAKQISYYEEQLAGLNFVRIHKQHMVNLLHVLKYNKGRGGSVVLTNNTILDVASRRKADFLDKLKLYHEKTV